ncbi:unnamed protein product [Mytilus coruscus]|uniref:B box-type domain-containing protein n=1 Tax=Mytilus coruscus TaxID=42192 RepID=A0A6J8D192_MYTCO|nr:unnamed protein product [Mytilus coruscus]
MASIQSIKTECDKHRKQLNLYCPSHLMPCCDECTSTSHSKCTGIQHLPSVVEETKIEKSKESVEKDINSILHLLDKIEDNISTNIKTGEQQCEDIKISIGVHQIEQKVQQCQQYVENLEKDDRVKTFDIKMKQNHKTKKILSKLGSLESLGQVTLVHSDIEVKRETSVRRKAQVQLQHSNINNMTMNMRQR